MKAILISIKPRYVADILNHKKTIEVRKSNVGKAVQKLIDENGYADIYVYCTKEKPYLANATELLTGKYACISNDEVSYKEQNLNGKVVFKFRCYKVDDYVNGCKWSWKVGVPMWGACNDYEYILKDACLTDDEIINYVEDLSFSAIYISDLEIFDKPKELYEFETTKQHLVGVLGQPQPILQNIRLAKAPQSFMFIEVE